MSKAVNETPTDAMTVRMKEKRKITTWIEQGPLITKTFIAMWINSGSATAYSITGTMISAERPISIAVRNAQKISPTTKYIAMSTKMCPSVYVHGVPPLYIILK